jgi:hypothetical protein
MRTRLKVYLSPLKLHTYKSSYKSFTVSKILTSIAVPTYSYFNGICNNMKKYYHKSLHIKIPPQTPLIDPSPVHIEIDESTNSTNSDIFDKSSTKLFNYNDYQKLMERQIQSLSELNSSPTFKCISSDILLEDYINNNKELMENARHLKHIQMRIGFIWQSAIGNFKSFKDLGVGHYTGLDIISHRRKIIMELKNRYNTDNSSSRKTNFDKLIRFKKANPDYTCIYGVINDINIKGIHKVIQHEGIDIQYYSGDELLKYVFGKDCHQIKNILILNVNKHLINKK